MYEVWCCIVAYQQPSNTPSAVVFYLGVVIRIGYHGVATSTIFD
jgi:hypothetical protein